MTSKGLAPRMSNVNDFQAISPAEDGWVDARALHGKLGIKTQFSIWMKRHIASGRYTEDVDYLIINQKWLKSGKIGVFHDYRLSLFMAELIALMADTSVGHEVRKFYVALRRNSTQMAEENKTLRDKIACLLTPTFKKKKKKNRFIWLECGKVMMQDIVTGAWLWKAYSKQVPYDQAPNAAKELEKSKQRKKVMRGLTEAEIAGEAIINTNADGAYAIADSVLAKEQSKALVSAKNEFGWWS